MHSNLCCQLKIGCYKHKLLDGLMVTTKHKPVVDAQKMKRRIPSIPLKKIIKPQWKGVGEEEKNGRNHKIARKQLTKGNNYIPISNYIKCK